MEKEPIRRHIRYGGKLTHSGVEILPNGKDIEYIVIEKIEFKEKEKINGKEQDAFIAYFAPNPYTKLPMVLNMVNKKLLCKQARVDEWHLEDVKNFPVRLTKEETSQMGWGLRISKLPPKKPLLAVLSPEHPNWGKCIDYLKKGNSVEDLRKGYEISEEIEKLLIEKTKK
jgi:hypothetical protein